jgi:hypothetical protein
MSAYEKQATNFCERYNTTITPIYTGHRKYFPGDTTPRATFSVTIARTGKAPYTFDFGQSLVNSYKATVGFPGEPGCYTVRTVPQWFNFSWLEEVGKEVWVMLGGKMRRVVLQLATTPPTSYDILAALTKNDPGTFEDFCGNYGYDEDSRKAESVYFSVQKEWANVRRLFADCLEESEEIN